MLTIIAKLDNHATPPETFDRPAFARRVCLARAKFIPKPEAGKVRWLRLESLLTKLIEKCIKHPLFPSFGPDPGVIAPEHF